MEENKALVLRWVEARNASDVEAAVLAWAEDKGKGLRQAFDSFSKGFPDIHITVEDLLAEGDKVVLHATMRGTQSGTWAGVAPTGKQVHYRTIDIYTIQDGRIQSVVRAGPDLRAMLTGSS